MAAAGQGRYHRRMSATDHLFRAGTIVLVTGASSGIGAAVARRLGRQKCHLALFARRAAELGAVAGAVGQAGLSGLVNNAGIVVPGPIEFLPLPELRRQLEINVIGQVAVTQAFLPLVRAGRGRIVNMGSISGRMATPFTGAYGASKFALEALTDALRLELAPWGISVSIVEPGAVATPIWEKSARTAAAMLSAAPPEALALYAEAIEAVKERAERAARGAVDPAEVARAVGHALTSAKPRTRYVVGREAKIQAALALLAPDRVRDSLVARSMGLPKAAPSAAPKAGEGAWG